MKDKVKRNEYLHCVICKDPMQEPVTVSSEGGFFSQCHHSYCGDCLSKCISEGRDYPRCPKCNQFISLVRRNHEIESIIDVY